MSQNLTQPEEIEHILKEMASHNGDMDMPNPDGEPLNSGAHGFECDWSIGSTGNE